MKATILTTLYKQPKQAKYVWGLVGFEIAQMGKVHIGPICSVDMLDRKLLIFICFQGWERGHLKWGRSYRSEQSIDRQAYFDPSMYARDLFARLEEGYQFVPSNQREQILPGFEAHINKQVLALYLSKPEIFE